MAVGTSNGQADQFLRQPAFPGSFVGRAAELRIARMVLGRAIRGHGQVLGMTGEPGIGKSRLVAEVLQAARPLGFVAYGGACRTDRADTAYLVWHSIWRALFQVDASLPVGEAQAQLVATVAAHDGAPSQRAPLLAPVVNLPLSDSELTSSLDPPARAELLRSLLLDQLRRCAATAPLLLVLEDCHWIDPASQLLLELLARNVVEQRVLIVATSRPIAAGSAFTGLASLAHFTGIRLAELSAGDAERLAAERIHTLRGGEQAVPRDAVRQVVAWAGGNPFRLEELVSFLLAHGRDPHAPGTIDELGVPDDLRSLVLARTDQLDEGARTTLEVASVLGQRFPASWIWGCDPAAGGARRVIRHLNRLAELDLIRPHTPSTDPEYRWFKHAITREAVYESLSPRRREQLHERVARFIERTYLQRLGEFVDVLAHHYGQTRNIAKQREWFHAAADAAKAAFATDAAIGYFERLLALLAERESGEVLIELGDLLRLAARWVDAERAYEAALRVARLTADRHVHAAASRGLGSVLPFVPPHEQSFDRAIDQLRRAVAEFEQLGDERGLATTLERLAWTSWEGGDFPGGLAASERHLEIATGAHDHAGMSAALGNMGVVRWLTGDHDEALVLLRRALDEAIVAGESPRIILAANDLAGLLAECGEHVAAIGPFRQALSVAQDIGDRRMTTVVIGNIGELHRWHGEHDRALRCFSHAFRTAVEMGDRIGMVVQAGRLALTLAAKGRARDAERLSAAGIGLARHLDARKYLCDLLYEYARLLAAAGRLDEAERAGREAFEIASEQRQRRVELPARLLSIRLRVELGRMDRGEATRELRTLRDTCVDRSEQVAVLDAIWQLDPTQTAAREAASDLYRSLLERAPSVEYREAYQRLSGEALPPGSPLPAVPDGVSREPFDLTDVLRQLDLAAWSGHAEEARVG